MKRSPQEILADPQATGTELQELVAQNPEEVAAHANCPADLWWQLLIMYPLCALQSPAAPLYVLEDPTRYAVVELNSLVDWLGVLDEQLVDDADAQYIPILAIERVLTPAMSYTPPRVSESLQRCLARRREFAAGKMTIDKYLKLAGIILENVFTQTLNDANPRIARCIANALEAQAPREVIDETIRAAGSLASSTWGSRLWTDAANEQALWVWRTLLAMHMKRIANA